MNLVTNIDQIEQGCACTRIYKIFSVSTCSSILVLDSLCMNSRDTFWKSLPAPGCAHEPLNYIGDASTPLFWWCKVSLHLVIVTLTHMTMLGAPWVCMTGVRFSFSMFECGQEKAKSASVAWCGGVSARGWNWIICLRDLEQIFFHWALWHICPFPAQCNPPTTHPLIPASDTPSLHPQTSPNNIYTTNSGGMAQI